MKKRLLLLLAMVLVTIPNVMAQLENITSGGKTRQMYVYVPKNLGENRPLMISCHGMNQDWKYQRDMTKYEDIADTAKFAVVYPQGEGNSWDIGGDKDINFVLDIIEDMHKRYKINKNRVYLSGFSMGGMFTYHAMTKIADKIAAFAPVSGYNMGGPNARSSRPVPIIHVHGTDDDVCTYGPVQSHIDAWVNRNKCDKTPIIEKPTRCNPNTQAQIFRYCNGEKGVEVAHQKMPGKGHWPSNDYNSALSNHEIWTFCSRWSLVEGPKVLTAYPEDDSFDMLPDEHRQFRLTFNKPVNTDLLKATITRNTASYKMQVDAQDEGKTLILTIPENAAISNTSWQLCLSNLESTDGGRSADVKFNYKYGVEEVGDKLNIDTIFNGSWDGMRELVGEGIPKGWTCVTTDANGKTTTKKYTDEADSKSSRLRFFDAESDFQSAFLLYPYRNEKVELRSGAENATRFTLRKGTSAIYLNSTYANSRSKTSQVAFKVKIVNKDGTETIFESEDLLSEGYARDNKDNVTGTKAHKLLVDVEKAGLYTIYYTLERPFVSTAISDGVLVSAPIITTTPSSADFYKGGFLRTLKRAKELLLTQKDCEGEAYAELDNHFNNLAQVIAQYEGFTSIQPSDYTTATAALEEAMEPILATSIQSAQTTPAQSPLIYDLTGRRVTLPQRGIYIKEGKKYTPQPHAL